MAKNGQIASEAGAWLIVAAAVAGLAVSIFNYFNPQSGIAGEPGTLLVIASTAILALLGSLMSRNALRGAFLLGFVAVAALLDIIGTAFAGYLLHSQALFILMLVCLLGWLLHMFMPRSALA